MYLSNDEGLTNDANPPNSGKTGSSAIADHFLAALRGFFWWLFAISVSNMSGVKKGTRSVGILNSLAAIFSACARSFLYSSRPIFSLEIFFSSSWGVIFNGNLLGFTALSGRARWKGLRFRCVFHCYLGTIFGSAHQKIVTSFVFIVFFSQKNRK